MNDDQAEDVEICEIVITAPDAEWLATFCRSLIEDRLAAAVHIIEDVHTLYRWEGEVRDDREARAHLRTRRQLSEAVMARVRAEHPYTVPSVVAFDVTVLNPHYRHWLVQQTIGRGASSR